MKKFFALFVVALIGVQPLSAQFKFGVKAGANFSSVPVKNLSFDSSPMTGFHVGPMAQFSIPLLPLAVDGAILFSQKGSKLTKENAVEVLKTNNIEIPLNLKLMYPVVPMVRMIAQVGPNFSFMFNNNGPEVVKDLSLQEVKAQKVGVGINAGIGVDIIGRFQVTAQYTAPVSTDYTFRSAAQTAGDFISAKNKVFSLSAAVLF